MIISGFYKYLLQKFTTWTSKVSMALNSVKIENISCAKYLVFPAENFNMPELKDIFGRSHPYFNTYSASIPAFYIRELENVFVFLYREEIYSRKRKLIINHTTQKKNPMFGKKISFENVKKIDGGVLHLNLNGLENNYYHWLVECLGRLNLLKKAGISPDYYIVSDTLFFQKQWLEILGIRPEKIIHGSSFSDDSKLVQVKRLIVPTLINNWKLVQYMPGYDAYMKIWMPSWLGNLYKDITTEMNISEPNKIYITRINARHRKIVNENELIPLLKERDYAIIDLDTLSVVQQIKTFQNAKSIVGIHGAGLVNMFLSDAGTKLLEIYPFNYFDPSFRIQAKVLGVEYHYIIGEKVKGQTIHPQQTDIYLDPVLFKEALCKFEE